MLNPASGGASELGIRHAKAIAGSFSQLIFSGVSGIIALGWLNSPYLSEPAQRHWRPAPPDLPATAALSWSPAAAQPRQARRPLLRDQGISSEARYLADGALASNFQPRSPHGTQQGCVDSELCTAMELSAVPQTGSRFIVMFLQILMLLGDLGKCRMISCCVVRERGGRSWLGGRRARGGLGW